MKTVKYIKINQYCVYTDDSRNLYISESNDIYHVSKIPTYQFLEGYITGRYEIEIKDNEANNKLIIFHYVITRQNYEYECKKIDNHIKPANMKRVYPIHQKFDKLDFENTCLHRKITKIKNENRQLRFDVEFNKCVNIIILIALIYTCMIR